jgi:DNA-binding MarR family transcriptional regulator
MTQIVSRMEEQGWVERRVLANDRRGVEVVITAEGRRLAAQVLASRTSFIEERLSHLSEAERQALSRAIPALDGMLK